MSNTPRENDSSSNRKSGSDRRRSERFDTRIQVLVQCPPDAPSLESWAIEIGANGMKLVTPIRLSEKTAILISFRNASNNTHCEGVVVWSRQVPGTESFEAGVDIKRWGGDLPSDEFIRQAPNLRLKPDRRRPR